MRILTRKSASEKWEDAKPVKTELEVELQNLISNSPSIIPIEEIREGVPQFLFGVCEFGLPGSGNTDVLAFNENGDIAIIECKLATNPESKRKVIGQILEYAAYLWEMDYSEVNERIQRLKSKSLSDLIAESIAGEWDEESFRNGVKQSLESGSFILIIVVDEINDELKRIIRYINECSKSSFTLHALEMQRFQAHSLEIIVPNLYGISPKVSEPVRKQWTSDKFFNVLESNVDTEATVVVRDIFEWSEKTADRIWLGSGATTGSFTFHYLKEGKTVSVFSVFTKGTLMLNYGWLVNQIEIEQLKKFHDFIHQIAGFQRIPSTFPGKYPSVKVIDVFNNSDALEKFKKAVEWLGKQIH